MKTYTQLVQWIRLPSGRFVNLAHVTDISDDGAEMYYAMMTKNEYGMEILYTTTNTLEDAAALVAYMEQHAVKLEKLQ